MENIKNFFNYVNETCNNIYQSVKSLQKRKRKCNVSNIFTNMTLSSFSDNSESNFRHLYNQNKQLSKGAISYWRSKIYELDFDYNFHNYAVDKKIISKQPDINKYIHIFQKFNVLVGDGTKTKTAYTNKNKIDKNIATINTVYIYDVLHKTFRDHKIAYDNNEHTALLEHSLNKKDLIILDRYYSSYELINTLKTHTNFMIRLKSSLSVVKDFLQEDKNTKVIVYKGSRLRLVKYWIDKKTQTIILDKYNNDNDISEEDLSECYVLATNVISLIADECIFLYKKRWSIEIAFKQLKQHFRIRYVCKNLTSNDSLKKCKFWYNYSLMMFNMASILKNIIDSENEIDCRYSECVRLIRGIITRLVKMRDIDDEISYIIRNKNYPRKKERIIKRKESKRGVYKSIITINKINKYYGECIT